MDFSKARRAEQLVALEAGLLGLLVGLEPKPRAHAPHQRHARVGVGGALLFPEVSNSNMLKDRGLGVGSTASPLGKLRMKYKLEGCG